MVDFETKLKCLIDSYQLRVLSVQRQARMDDEYGYHGSCQFNKGQAFTLDYVLDDLRQLQALLQKED